MTDSNNIIYQKAFAFAIRCVRLYKYLKERDKSFDLNHQILRSGTSIGANVKEALRGQSKADFGARMNIALREASETEYWIELLHATDYLSQKEYESILPDCKELIAILTAIVKTTFKDKDKSSSK